MDTLTNWYDTIVASLKTAIETVFEQKENKVTSWSSTTTDAHYPSEKLVKDSLDAKANSSHTQASSTITDMGTVQVVVTYTDSTSETLTLFKQVSSQ